MPRFQVTILLDIISDTPQGAEEIAQNAVEHLHDTFLERGSIDAAFVTTVIKLED